MSGRNHTDVSGLAALVMLAVLVWALSALLARSQVSDPIRPNAVQAANAVTDASGGWSVAWGRPFLSDKPAITVVVVNPGTLPIVCNASARSSTAAAGRCWQASATTLGGTLGTITGRVVNPFADPAAGAAVMVIGREPTQQ